MTLFVYVQKNLALYSVFIQDEDEAAGVAAGGADEVSSN